jgi:outer membrane protein
MKTLAALLPAAFVLALVSPAAHAQDERSALVPLPSIDDFTRGEDGWSFGLGLALEYETAYEGSDEFGFEIDPAGAAQWRRGDDIFFWAGEALGWRGLRSDRWLFQATVGYDEGRREDDSGDGRLEGLGDADGGIEVVLQTRRSFDAEWRYWLDGRIVTGEHGNLGIFGVGRRFGDRNDGTGSEVSIVAVFHDGERANREFGVDAVQSLASGLDETRLSGGFRSLGLNYTYRYRIREHWQLFGEVLFERYASDITDSPIARSNFEGEVGGGFIYLF